MNFELQTWVGAHRTQIYSPFSALVSSTSEKKGSSLCQGQTEEEPKRDASDSPEKDYLQLDTQGRERENE